MLRQTLDADALESLGRDARHVQQVIRQCMRL